VSSASWRNLSQGERAARLSVARQTINSIEVGRYLPSLPLALSMGRLFQSAPLSLVVLRASPVYMRSYISALRL
jgi:putative transcriptional regulator